MSKVSLLCRFSLMLWCFLALGEVHAQTQALNFKESFEDQNFPPSGWQINCSTSSNEGWKKDDGTTFGPGSVSDGDFAAMADMYGLTAGAKASLITPVLDFSTMLNPVVIFDWNAKPGDDPQPMMKVFLSRDGGNTFTEEVFNHVANGHTRFWKTEHLFLENPGAQAVLKFEATSDYGSANLFLDNLKIEETVNSAVAEISVPGMSFDVVLIGEKLEYGLFLRNLGRDDLILESLDIEAPFSLKESLPITLKKGEKTVLNFELAPTEKGPFQQSVKFNYKTSTLGAQELILNGVGVPPSYEYEGFEEDLLDIWEIEQIVNNKWAIDGYGVEGKRQIALGAKFQNAEYYSSTSRFITPELETKDGEYFFFYAFKTGDVEDVVLELQYFDEATNEFVKFKNIPLSPYATLYAYDLSEIPVDHAKLAFYGITRDGYSSIAIDALRYPQLYLGDTPPSPAVLTAPLDYASDLPTRIKLEWEREAKARGYYLYVGEDANPTMPVLGEDLPAGWEDVKKETSKDLTFEFQKTYRWMVLPYNENGLPTDNKLSTFTVHNDPTISEFPYFQGFEKQAPPVGWENIDGYWYQNGKPNSGSYGAGTSRTHKGPAIMNTPYFVVGDQDLRVSFYWKDDGFGKLVDQIGKSRVQGLDTTYFEVTNDEGLNWEILDVCAGKTSGYERNYKKAQHNLAKYKNQKIQFRWRDINWQSGDSYGVSIDDFRIESAPSIPLAETNFTSWDFGELALGIKEAAPFKFILKNDGPGNLKINSISGLEGSCFTSNLNPSSVDLAYWEEIEFTVFAQPTEVGLQSAHMNIDCGDGGILAIELIAEGNPKDDVSGDFENSIPFTDQVAPFISLDKDNRKNSFSRDFYFKCQGEKIGFFSFNPSATYPPIDDDKIYDAHSGDKYMVSFVLDNPDPNNPKPNNDWLILPDVDVKNGDVFKFWAKSLVDHYGMERVVVLVNEGDPEDVASYSKIHPEEFFGIPADVWYPLFFDLSAFKGKKVNIAIQCVSVDAYMLMIDDVVIESPTGVSQSFDFEDQVDVYPNPANKAVSIDSDQEVILQILDQSGRVMLERNIQKGTSNRLDTSSLPAGVYVVHYLSKDKSYSQKLIINH